MAGTEGLVQSNRVFRIGDTFMLNKNILFVDDEKKILLLLEKAFTKAGYRVFTAGGAEEALELLKTEEIHVMFLDLNLPGLSGLDLCRRLRRERPMDMIFALTGYASLFELSECREAGFDDYFTKPADLKLLKETAREAFEKRARWKKG